MSEDINREDIYPGQVTIAKTRDGAGYGHTGNPKDKFNYFIDNYPDLGPDKYDMVYLFINTGRTPEKGLYIDARDAEIMGLQLVYLARQMMKEKGADHEPGK